MNYGTPQEMIDEEIDYYESINKKPPKSGCFFICVIIIITLTILIIKKI